MNRQDLINSVYAKLEEKVPKNIIEKVIKAEEDAKLDALAAGDNVQLIGFGTYETRKRSARTGRNPQTGAEIAIHASQTIAFKPGKHAKGRVN
jgi:DNA-binding protein HU-beta